MSGVGLGGRESDLTIPECGLAIMERLSRLSASISLSGQRSGSAENEKHNMTKQHVSCNLKCCVSLIRNTTEQ